MGIIFVIAFVFVLTWFFLSFRKIVGIFVCGPMAYATFMWGKNFIGGENFPVVQVYGWVFMALAAWCALTVIATIAEVIDDIITELKPDPADKY